MKPVNKMLMCVLALGVAAMPLAGPAMAQQQPAAPRTVLAVVNLAKIFDGLNEKIDNAAELDKLKRDLQAEQSKRKDEIDNLSGSLGKTFREGTDEYKAAQDNILKKAMDLQSFSSYAQQKIALETRLRYVKLYNDVNKAVEAYAKAAGIVMVFVADDADLGTTADPSEVLNRISNRKVMYADPNYDISGKIIEKMNTEYRLGSNKPG